MQSGRTVRIKAVTIWQPWASLLTCGFKKYETRPFRTRYRGPLAIHASKRENCHWGRDRKFYLAAAAGFGLTGPEAIADFNRLIPKLPYGKVIGICSLRDCREILDDTWRDQTRDEMELGDWTPGRYLWEPRDMVALAEPVEARGYQWLWDWDAPADLVERMAA